MRCSANEVTTLATKAARGAGAPPAQATAFGRAALSHLGAGCAPDDLMTALEALPGGPILEMPVRIAKLLEGAAADIVSGEIVQGPFAALELSYFYAQPFAVKGKTTGQAIEVQLLLAVPHKPPPMTRVDIPDPLAAELQAFAARILVPDSDASRLSGAGAGLTDND